jgi:hypothetical protein
MLYQPLHGKLAQGGGKVSNVGTICRNGDVVLLDDGSKGHTNLEARLFSLWSPPCS